MHPAIDLRAAEFESVLALHLDECGPPGLALGEAYMADVAKMEDRESNEVTGFLLSRLDFKIVAIVKQKVKGRSKWGAARNQFWYVPNPCVFITMPRQDILQVTKYCKYQIVYPAEPAPTELL